jgi:hypothetical protein
MCLCVVLSRKVHRAGLSNSYVLCPLFFVHCPFDVLCPIVSKPNLDMSLDPDTMAHHAETVRITRAIRYTYGF